MNLRNIFDITALRQRLDLSAWRKIFDLTTTDETHRRYIKIFWIAYSTILGSLLFLFILIGFGAFGKIPSFEVLENPKSNLASQIFSADGKLIGQFFEENRIPVEFENLSPDLVNALIATEDARFYKHSGIDIIALLRVVKGVVTFNLLGGGSTISQQLAKNLFPREPARNSFFVSRIFRLGINKLKEWLTAIKLEPCILTLFRLVTKLME